MDVVIDASAAVHARGLICDGRSFLHFVVFSEEDVPLYRIITAFDAEGRWLDEYQRQQEGL